MLTSVRVEVRCGARQARLRHLEDQNTLRQIRDENERARIAFEAKVAARTPRATHAQSLSLIHI